MIGPIGYDAYKLAYPPEHEMDEPEEPETDPWWDGIEDMTPEQAEEHVRIMDMLATVAALELMQAMEAK